MCPKLLTVYNYLPYSQKCLSVKNFECILKILFLKNWVLLISMPMYKIKIDQIETCSVYRDSIALSSLQSTDLRISNFR